MIVLDASLAIEWLFDQSPQLAFTDIDNALSGSAVIVPCHWPLEISNTLRPDLRDNKLSISDFHVIMERLDRLAIQVQPPIDLDEIGPLSRFAVTYNLTSYDAAYVQLAFQQQATLGTLNRAMRRTAARLKIPLIPVSAP